MTLLSRVVEFTGHSLSAEILLCTGMGAGGNGNNQWEFEENWNKPGNGNGNEPLGMGGNGIKKDIPSHL